MPSFTLKHFIFGHALKSLLFRQGPSLFFIDLVPRASIQVLIFEIRQKIGRVSTGDGDCFAIARRSAENAPHRYSVLR